MPKPLRLVLNPLRRGLSLEKFTVEKDLLVLTRVLMQSPFVNVLIGVLGSYLFLVGSLDAYTFYSRMGFARLAEDSIRKIRGKSETDKLGALDKILASSIGGALATWNQPIEVIRVEVNSQCIGTAL